MDTIVGLDIGTSSIKSLIAQKKSGDLELDILAQSKEISSGVRKGVVIDVDKVAEIIKSCLDKLQELSERKIKSVFVNVGGSHVFSTYSKGLISVSRADQKISREDIERVVKAAQTFSLPSNKEILSVFPRKFMVDEEEGVKEPLGMQGVRLEAEVLAVGCFSPYLKNLTQAVLENGFKIEDLILTPLASARAVLTRREKELGSALIDIGAGTTGLAVFEEGDLIHASILPVGSAHITNDIAIGFKCDIDTAEKIKLEFGTCLFKGSDKKKKIETLTGETITLSQKLLNRIIEARVSEIFEEINKEFKKISRQVLLPGGAVLTGGGARLPRIKDLAKKELKLPCRIGLPKGFAHSLGEPELSAVAGLVLLSSDFEEESVFPSFGKGIISRLKRILKIFLP